MNPVRLLPALALIAALAGCSSAEQRAISERRHALAAPLATLANDGDLPALQMVADIEVLRASGFLTDGATDRLLEMPASAFLGITKTGGSEPSGRGMAVVTLIEYQRAERDLMSAGLVSPTDSVTIRTLTDGDLVPAHERATEYLARRKTP